MYIKVRAGSHPPLPDLLTLGAAFEAKTTRFLPLSLTQQLNSQQRGFAISRRTDSQRTVSSQPAARESFAACVLEKSWRIKIRYDYFCQ